MNRPAMLALVLAWGCAAPVREPLASPEVGAAIGGEVVRPAPMSSEPSSVAVLPSGAAPERSPLDAIVRPDLVGGATTAGSTRHRMILFTFDDGPHPVHTRALLDHLDRAEVRAVFFVVARRLGATSGPHVESAAVLREIAARGHVIGSHTRDHLHLHRLGRAEIAEQIDSASALIEHALGARPWLFRPPGGMRSPESDALLAERGYTQLLWNVGSADWLTESADQVVANVRNTLRARERRGEPGGIVLMHDTHPWTVEAFPRIVDWIDARNCELLAEGEELYDIVDDPALFFVPRAPGSDPSENAGPIELAPDILASRQARARERAERRCASR